MDSGYLDLGLDSDSEGDDEGAMDCLDSDEEEAMQNEALLKIMCMPHARTKKEINIENFEAEMEMELNRRAQAVETLGGVEHQKSLSRSSSTSSLQACLTSLPEPEAASSSSKAKPIIIKNQNKNPKFSKKTVRFIEDKLKESNEKNGSESDKTKAYDDVYFDSDESESEEGAGAGAGADAGRKTKKASTRKVLSNDDLFYDPNSDDKDQTWVDKQRSDYILEKKLNHESNAGVSNDQQKPLPNSDAVLNCPACFTLLCLDCQRHDFYQGQYRAMFVKNCVTDKSENRYVPAKSEKQRSRKRKLNQGQGIASTVDSNPSFQTDTSSTFNPVKCKICNTEVAVFDSDEVYHFYNVLTSHT